MSNKILQEVNSYYTNKLKDNGPTPKGVDWNSVESQELRFRQLSDVITEKDNFSVLDYGCGFGALYSYFKSAGYQNFTFTGLDISEEMIFEAIKQYGNETNTQWYNELPASFRADYVISSGIFNVKFNNSKEDWEAYMLNTLKIMDSLSEKGFSFNVLTSYSDKEFMKETLYYADPLFIFDYCKKHFSKYVALKHDYPLYEFTIIVRK